MPSLVQVRQLRYRYDDGTVAVDGIDFDLQEGECVILFGANGSGKTSFILHLNGLLTGDGAVTVCGMPVVPANYREIRRRVGLVFQDSDEQLFMPTVYSDVAYGPMNLGCSPEEVRSRANLALAHVGMSSSAERAPYHLSAGEKRRVAIAGVLAMEPELLILDEPTTYLDPPSQRELAQLLRSLPQAKIVATHDASFARAIGDRAVFFRKGRIAGTGSVDEILTEFDWDVR